MNNRLGFEDNLHWDILANFCVGELKRGWSLIQCYLGQQTCVQCSVCFQIVGLTLCVS